MSQHAVQERHSLAQTLRAADPSASTLCGEWNTAQLAAHLVLRERSILEAGRFLPIAALARRTEQAVDEFAARTPFGELVDAIDRGPTWRDVQGPVPTAWLWSLPPVREQVNLLEYLVHNEDVRRAGEQRQARDLAADTQRAIWERLHLLARMTLRGLPLGVRLQWPGQGEIGSRLVRRGSPAVTVIGDPVELTLFAFGRGAVADVTYDGSPADVAAVRESDISL